MAQGDWKRKYGKPKYELTTVENASTVKHKYKSAGVENVSTETGRAILTQTW